MDDYKNSEVFQEIKQDFRRRKTGEVYGISREVFYCKFLRKLKFKPCYRKIRISFSQSTDEVLVEEVIPHKHEINEETPDAQKRSKISIATFLVFIIYNLASHNLTQKWLS